MTRPGTLASAACLLCAALAGCAGASRGPVPPPGPGEVVQALFRNMEASDTAAIRRLFLPRAQLSSIQLPGRATPRMMTVDEFIQMVARAPGPYRETMRRLEVRSDGALATVWGRYEFRVGARFTNCGFNSAQLVLTGGEWRIVSLGSSIRTSVADCGRRRDSAQGQ